VIGGLLGIAVVVSFLTVLYWRHTTPIAVGGHEDDDERDGAAAASWDDVSDAPETEPRATAAASVVAGPEATVRAAAPGDRAGASVLDPEPMRIVTLEDLSDGGDGGTDLD
jgi:hypothetical protein